MENVIIPQCYTYNEGEEQIKKILKKHNYNFQTQYPIVIEAIPTRGVYLVRLTMPDGSIYQSKLVVE